MYILAIETTGAYASVALTDGEKILAQVQGNDRFSHLQNLMPQVEMVMSEAGLPLGDVTAIAVSVGPGSFTGIRIGVSSARALAQILKLPCIAVSSLQALAMRAENYPEGSLICPMLDARRSQVYAGGYVISDGYPVEKVQAGPYSLEEFFQAVKCYDNVFIMGDGVDAYAGKLADCRTMGLVICPEERRYQQADTVAILAAENYQKEGGIEYDKLQPDYMRIPEAERKLKEEKAKQEK